MLGGKFVLPAIQASVKCPYLGAISSLVFKLGSLTNLKALFPVMLTDFP